MAFDSIGMTLPVWLLGLTSNALVLLGSWWIARHGLKLKLKQARGITAFLGTAVVFWTACTIGLEVLSPFGAISAGGLLAWSVLWLAIGAAVRWLRGQSNDDQAREGPEPAFSIEALIGLGLLLAAGLDSRHAIAVAGGQGGQ